MFDSLNGNAFWSGQVYLTFRILQCLVLVKADCFLSLGCGELTFLTCLKAGFLMAWLMYTWMKVFRIIPDFRRLISPCKV